MIVKITGGLGNQIFQYAFAKALQYKYPQMKVELDTHFYEEKEVHNGYELENVFGINEQYYVGNSTVRELINKIHVKLGIVRGAKSVQRKDYFAEISIGYFLDCTDDISEEMYFDGYWQSESYFDNITEQVRSALKFTPINEGKNARVAQIIDETVSVALHVRRGDYLSSGRYICLGNTQYYKEAVKLLKEKIPAPRFFVFSDDIEWCRNELNLPADSIFVDWNNGSNSFRDMQLMSMCKHNIIANSSFSWWGAWLNSSPEKIVIAPNHFYKKDSGFDDSMLIPKKWITIPVE